MSDRRVDPVATLLPWVLLLALAAALSLHRIQSYDYWWHLQTGWLIADTGSVPRSDPYTYTVPGARWIDIHWLFQLGLHAVHRLGSHAAVVVAQLGLVLALLALLAPIGYRRERPFVSVAALGLLLLVICTRFMPRPELLSFVLLAAVLRLFDRFERTGDGWIYAIVPLQILWTNVHGLFAVGIAVCALQLAGELLLPLGESGGRLRRDRVRRLAAVTVLAALAALVNPNGLDGALYPLQQLQMVGAEESRNFFGRHNTELQPTLSALLPMGLFLFLLLTASSLVALALNWRRIPPSDGLLWLAFLYLGLGAKRNVALFAVVATPILVRNSNALLDGRGWGRQGARLGGALVAAALALLAWDGARGSFHGRVGTEHVAGLGVDEMLYPVKAVDWIERHRPPGPIAHTMRDGGYLIHRLHPEYPVMIDGRLEVFGPETFRKLNLGGPEEFAALDAEYGFGSVLVRLGLDSTLPLIAAWHADPGWRLVFADDVAVVFVRTRPGAEPFPEVDVTTPGHFPPLGDEFDRDTGLRLHNRTELFQALGRPDLALAMWADALQRFPANQRMRRVRSALRDL